MATWTSWELTGVAKRLFGFTEPHDHFASSSRVTPRPLLDASEVVDRGGLKYVVNSETPFTGVMVNKHENGQKKSEATVKDGEHCVALAVLNEFLKAKRVKELSHADG